MNTDIAVLRKAAHPAITHCEGCGCDWLDNGLNPVGCPYCKLSAETAGASTSNASPSTPSTPCSRHGEEDVMQKVAKVIEPAVRRYEWLRSILGDVGFVSDPFPEEECIVPSNETGVFDGTSTYLCVITDTRFEHYFRIHLMSPYVYREDDCVAYGWFDVETSFFASNWKNPVTDVYNEYVVAWKRVK